MKFTETKLPGGRVRIRWRERRPGGGYVRPQETLDSADEAAIRKAEIIRMNSTGVIGIHEARRTTLREVAARWFDASRLTSNTLKSYAGAFDRHIDPYLGERPIVDLARPALIEAWQQQLAQGMQRPNGTWSRRPVGEPSCRRVLMVLSAILTYAERHQYIQSHGVRLMDRSTKPSGRRQREIEPLSVEQVEAIRAWMLTSAPVAKPADRLRCAAMISALAYTGLRPGELLGLTRRDVRERTTTVRATVVDGVRENRVKTRRSRPRSPRLIAPLRADLDAWVEHVAVEPDSLVFGHPDGRPWTKDDWDNWRNRVFKPALDATGVPRATRPYDLRHTCVSLRVMQGDNVVEIADDLGHNVSMTLDTYSHVVGEYRGLSASDRPSMAEMVARARSRTDDHTPLVIEHPAFEIGVREHPVEAAVH
jgi:integrase